MSKSVCWRFFPRFGSWKEISSDSLPQALIYSLIKPSWVGWGAVKRVHIKSKILSAQSGVHPRPPRVLKTGAKTLQAIPRGTEKHLQLWSPGVCPISLPAVSPLLLLFPSLPFIPGTIVRASSFGLLHIPCQKQKPFLTPDDQGL